MWVSFRICCVQPLALWGPVAIINEWLFTANGLTLYGAIGLFILIAVLSYFWARRGNDVRAGLGRMPATRQRVLKVGVFVILIVILLALPQVLGLFLSEVITIVGLYVLLGLGLNIVRGICRPLGPGLRGLLRHWCLHDGHPDVTRTRVLQLILLGGFALFSHHGGYLWGVAGDSCP